MAKLRMAIRCLRIWVWKVKLIINIIFPYILNSDQGNLRGQAKYRWVMIQIRTFVGA